MGSEGGIGTMHAARRKRSAGCVACAAWLLAAVWATPVTAAEESALTYKPIPMLKETEEVKIDPETDEVGPRAAPPLEIGPEFLNVGNLPRGYELPTGAVWTPSLWMFGSYRTALNYFNPPNTPTRAEWAHRLDLFFNLALSPTERILFGISPLHRRGEFTLVSFAPNGRDSEFKLNRHVETLFFEGEFGEIFPNLAPNDNEGLDFGFSVGRQPIFFQEGIMFNDTLDAVALTRDTIQLPGYSPDMRLTVLYAWANVQRDNNVLDKDAHVFGAFTETDFMKSTVNVDAAYVLSSFNNGGDSAHFGVAAIQRFGHYNTAFRANASVSVERDTTVADDGVLLFAEVSRTHAYSEDITYLNAFWGIEHYSSAARAATAGGPLGQTGLLFAAVGLGTYGAPLGNRADDAFGAVVGHQWFFNHERTQLVLEAGGRYDYSGRDIVSGAVGGRLQFALGNRYVLQFDGFVVGVEDDGVGTGARTEFQVRF